MDSIVSYKISGKTLVVTDLHIGLKKANQSRLSIIVKVFKNFLKTVKDEGVKNVICCGDVFHSRIALDLQALNVGLKLLSALAEKCECWLILGNHDLYYKNTAAIHSSNVFKHIKNVHIVEDTTEVELNGERALFVPWLGTFEGRTKCAYDLMFGHFDIDGRYLIASYIEEHAADKKDAEIEVQDLIDNDSLLNEASSVKDIQSEVSNIRKKKLKSDDLVGDFVEYVKPYGVVYAGHIHGHKEFISKTREFVFVGSPYQQNFGEIGGVNGYYVLDERNKRKFFETEGVPKHVRIKISDVLKAGIDSFDFSIAKGNIVQKIYDVDVDLKTDAQINQRISDSLPFEETLSEYSVALSSDSTVITNESLETIKKSKLEYIRSYIDSMDDSALSAASIERHELFKMLESYFNLAMENC